MYNVAIGLCSIGRYINHKKKKKYKLKNSNMLKINTDIVLEHGRSRRLRSIVKFFIVFIEMNIKFQCVHYSKKSIFN